MKNKRFAVRLLITCCLMVFLCVPAFAAETVTELLQQSPFSATDTVKAFGDVTPDDLREGLENLSWKPIDFQVQLEVDQKYEADFLVRLPSPVDSGHAKNDRMCLEFFAARNESGAILKRPAIVVVHESGKSMTVGRLIARTLNQFSYHTFLLQLPCYGERNFGRKPFAAEMTTFMRQGIMDIRRAYDAVAALPMTDRRMIALQGTSLGGLVSSTVAGVDSPYDAVFLMLAGGDLASIIENGQKDAAKIRETIQKAKIDPDSLAVAIYGVEPNRFASRVNADRLWLYSGRYDQVIPLSNAVSFATAAGLKSSHHIVMPVNHYTGMLYLPVIMEHMHQQIQSLLNKQE